MKRAFIIGPYRADSDYQKLQNIRIAEKAAACAWSNGYAALCPHLNSAFFSGIRDEYVFLEGYKAWLTTLDKAKDDIIILLPNWTASDGSVDEFHIATSLDLPVFDYMPVDDHLVERETGHIMPTKKQPLSTDLCERCLRSFYRMTSGNENVVVLCQTCTRKVFRL